MRRVKDVDKSIEHRLWTVLYRMGFEYLSVEDGAILRMDGGVFNQLDAVAFDEEAGLVVECKASATVRRVDIQGVLAKLCDHRDKVRIVLNNDRTGIRKKVGGVLVLWSVAISDTDRERAKHDRILVLDNSSLEYYERLVKHIGSAARYQLLAEAFPNQGIEGLSLTVPAVESRMGDETVYTFAIPPAHLLKIAFVAHRASNDFGTYQRMVTASRLKKIREFIDEGGIFPTNIVVNFAGADGQRSGLRFDASAAVPGGLPGVKTGLLYLPAKYQSAWVIDGQHRLLGYSGHKWAEKSSLCVTAFDGLSASEQANLFVRINSEQRKVSANHLTELFATLNWASADPRLQMQAIISRAVQDLRKDVSSPFYNRVVLADEETTAERCITLQSITEALQKPGLFILSELKGKVRQYGVLWTGEPETTRVRLITVVNSWFGSIRPVASDMWDAGNGAGGLVATNRGIVACITILRNACDHLRSKDADFVMLTDRQLCDKLQPFAEVVGRYFAELSDAELNSLRSHYGNGAPAEISYRTAEAIQARYPDYNPSGLDKWKAERADAKVNETRTLTSSIEKRIHDCVLGVLKEEFGDDEPGWWRKLPLKVRQEATNRREADPDPNEIETYINLIDYREIVTSNWPLFEKQFAFSARGSKDDRTSWMASLNEIRNKVYHASGARLKMQDYEKAMEIDNWLKSKGV
jgi:DGQHR domain-containing protein